VRTALPWKFALAALVPLQVLAVRAQEPASAAAVVAAPASEPASEPSSAPTPVATSAHVPQWYDLDRLPFIPIPELQTAPHSGVNLGLFPVVLTSNDRDEIDTILAPDIVHSSYFGWGARGRIFRNVSEDEKWSVVGGAKQYVEREFDAEYDLGLQRDRSWSWILHAMYDRSGTGRFFGYGNASPLSAQTTYVASHIRLEVTAAHNFTRSLQLSYLVRAATGEIEASALGLLPFIADRYLTLGGIGDASELQQRMVFTYDTRDSVVAPHKGERLAVFAGITTRALGSSVDYTYYGVDATTYQPVAADVILVAHAALRYMPSYGNAPFWALSHLGGDRSVVGEAQPLRAYGDGRFVDRNCSAASVEARTRVGSLHMFKTDLKLELAPFVDTGKVFTAMSGSPVSHLHAGAGLGMRVIASPFVVAYMDVGFGREKAAIFTGIDYPF